VSEWQTDAPIRSASSTGSPWSIEAGDFLYARAHDGSVNTTRDRRTNLCEKTSKEMLWLKIRLKDRIRFALTFFKALREGEDSVKIEVVRNDDDMYLMTVTTDHMNSGFDERVYG